MRGASYAGVAFVAAVLMSGCIDPTMFEAPSDRPEFTGRMFREPISIPGWEAQDGIVGVTGEFPRDSGRSERTVHGHVDVGERGSINLTWDRTMDCRGSLPDHSLFYMSPSKDPEAMVVKEQHVLVCALRLVEDPQIRSVFVSPAAQGFTGLLSRGFPVAPMEWRALVFHSERGSEPETVYDSGWLGVTELVTSDLTLSAPSLEGDLCDAPDAYEVVRGPRGSADIGFTLGLDAWLEGTVQVDVAPSRLVRFADEWGSVWAPENGTAELGPAWNRTTDFTVRVDPQVPEPWDDEIGTGCGGIVLGTHQQTWTIRVEGVGIDGRPLVAEERLQVRVALAPTGPR